MDIKEDILSLVKQANPDNPLQYVHDIIREYTHDKLNSYILNCNDCDICNGPKSLAVGNPNATVMIVGESVSSEYGDSKEKTVLPFGNAEIDILNKVFESLNINQEELFVINTVNCWPYKTNDIQKSHRAPSIKERENCRIFIDYAIRLVQPLVIIALGGVAYNLFLDKKESISKGRGQWTKYKGISVMPTYHPGYFRYIEGKKDPEIVDSEKWDFFNDIKKAFLYIQENYPDNNLILDMIKKD